MTWNLQHAAVVGVMLAASATLGACGGGDNTPSSEMAVVTVLKSIRGGENLADSTKEVALLNSTGATVMAVRCALLAPRPPAAGGSTAGVLANVVLIDVSAADAEKAKGLGFSVFIATDYVSALIAGC